MTIGNGKAPASTFWAISIPHPENESGWHHLSKAMQRNNMQAHKAKSPLTTTSIVTTSVHCPPQTSTVHPLRLSVRPKVTFDLSVTIAGLLVFSVALTSRNDHGILRKCPDNALTQKGLVSHLEVPHKRLPAAERHWQRTSPAAWLIRLP